MMLARTTKFCRVSPEAFTGDLLQTQQALDTDRRAKFGATICCQLHNDCFGILVRRTDRRASSARQREGFFGATARRERLAKHRRSLSEANSQHLLADGGAQANPRAALASRRAAAGRTRQLKNCGNSHQMTSALKVFAAEGARPLDTIHLSTIFTRLPTFRDSAEATAAVLAEVAPDVEAAIACGFPHPIGSGNKVDTQGLANVSWGMVKLGVRWDSNQQLYQILALLDQNLESCCSIALSLAIDCFVVSQYRSSGCSPQRLAPLIRRHLEQADSQDLARYLSNCGKLGIEDGDLMLQLAEQLVQIVNKPQHCSNSALALARCGVAGAEGVVRLLAEKLVSLHQQPTTQEIANTFMALFEGGWTVQKELAMEMLRMYQMNYRNAIEHEHIQVLAGLEKHGVQDRDFAVQEMVEHLLESCPRKLRHKLGPVADTLQYTNFGYADMESAEKLRELSSLS